MKEKDCKVIGRENKNQETKNQESNKERKKDRKKERKKMGIENNRNIKA